MKIEQLCQTMKEYFSQFAVTRILLPISSVVLYVLTALRVLGNFVTMGSLVNTLVYILFFAVLILVLASCRFRDIAICTGIMGILNLIELLIDLFKYRYLAYGALIYLLLYGLVAFFAYRKSVHFN